MTTNKKSFSQSALAKAFTALLDFVSLRGFLMSTFNHRAPERAAAMIKVNDFMGTSARERAEIMRKTRGFTPNS